MSANDDDILRLLSDLPVIAPDPARATRLRAHAIELVVAATFATAYVIAFTRALLLARGWL